MTNGKVQKKKCVNKTKNTARGACFKSKPQFLTIWGSSQPKRVRVLLGSDPDHRFSDTVELLFSLFWIYRPGKMFIFGGFQCIPHPLLVWLISLPVNTLGYTQVSLFIPNSQRNYFVSHNSTVVVFILRYWYDIIAGVGWASPGSSDIPSTVALLYRYR